MELHRHPKHGETVKMADGKQLVVCAPLCFCFSKFGKLDKARIKGVLNDFFTPDDIAAAKKRLLSDIEQFQLDNVPKSKRRDSEGGLRASKEIDDILQIMTLLDEKKMLLELPCYVVDNTDNIPTLKLADGEMKYFNRKLDKFEEAVMHLQACFNRLYNSGVFRPLDTPGIPAQSVNVGNGNLSTKSTAATVTTGNLIDNEMGPGQSTSWSAVVAQGIMEHQSTTEMDTDLTDHGGEYTDFISRHRRKRLRRSSQLQAQAQTQPSTNVTNVSTNRKQTLDGQSKRRKPLVIGRRTQLSGIAVIAAAKPRLDKEVFCIDNVDVNLTATDIRQFVEGMNVRVVSCFETIPRRSKKQSQREEVPKDRKAFRLCILQADRDNLLDADNWPANITISNWFFKGQSKPEGQIAASVGSGVADLDKTVLISTDMEGTYGQTVQVDSHGGI
jgi:hypothetical protein